MYRQDAVPVLPPCMMALQVAVGLMLCCGAVSAGVACTAGQQQGQQNTLPVRTAESNLLLLSELEHTGQSDVWRAADGVGQIRVYFPV